VNNLVRTDFNGLSDFFVEEFWYKRAKDEPL